MATITERLELLTDAKTGGAISGIKGVTAETKAMGTAQTQATGVTGKLEGGLQKLGFSSQAAGAALKTGVALGAVAAGAAIVKFGKDSVQATAELGTSILALQRATGATAETSSKLIAITKDYGISAESATKSFGKLSVNIANHKTALEDDGIAIVKNKSGQIDFEKTLLNVADAYQKSGGGAEGMKIATDAFGKSGKDLIQILEQGRSGIKEMFDAVPDKQIFGQENLQDAEDYKLAMDNLKDAVHELQYAIGKALIPILTDVANAMATVTRGAVGMNDALEDITGVSAIASLGKSLTLLPSAVNKVTDVLGIGGKAHKEYADAAQKSAEANKKVADLATAGEKGTKEYAEAQKEARAAADDLGGAQTHVAKAPEDTIPASDKAKTKAEELANAQFAALDATNAMANAQLGIRGAFLNAKSAIAAQNKTLEDNAADSLEAREAQLRLDQSIVAVAASAAVQYSAQVKLAGGTETAYGKAQAQISAPEELKRTFPQLTGPINDHIWELGKIPPDKKTVAQFEATEAQRRVNEYLASLNAVTAAHARTIADNPEAFFSHGGWVQGSGSGDTVRAMLTPGEFVVSKAMLAGQAPLPASLGSLSSLSVTAAGGDSGGPLTVNLVLDGQVLGQASVDYINRQASRGPGPLVTSATAA